MSSSLILFWLIQLVFIGCLSQRSIVDIDEKPSPVTEPTSSKGEKLILVREKFVMKHTEHISQDQLDFSINLIQNLNGKVIYNHETANHYTSENGQFEFINLENDAQKAHLQQVIQAQKKYYSSKYPSLIESTFLQPQDYLRISDDSNLRDRRIDSDFIQNQKQLPFCILIPSYNNARKNLFKRNIDSILQQQYSNYRIVYMDDASADNTTETVINYLKGKFPTYKLQKTSETSENQTGEVNHINVKDYQFNKIKWKFVHNQKRRKAMFNIYHGALAFCQDHQIVLLVDGDDGFAGTQALTMLNRAYRETESLFIYSSYAMKKDFPLEDSAKRDLNSLLSLVKDDDYRIRYYSNRYSSKTLNYNDLGMLTSYQIGVAGDDVNVKAIQKGRLRKTIKFLMGSHILSFYTALLRKASMGNYLRKDGRFLDFAYDSALTMSLSELAYKRTFYFKEILYEYTAETGINDSAYDWTVATWDLIAKKPGMPLSEQQASAMLKKVLNQA